MTEVTEQRLGAGQLPGLLRLSRSAGWNQNEADWRLMLEIGHGWGLSLADGTLAASTLVLPYGGFAWISMVLVLPEQRRRGHASRLLRVAVADLENRALTPILDATPAGREVYRQEGFADRWTFKRYYMSHKPSAIADVAEVRPIGESDWPWILELDAEAFGASRAPLLRGMHRRLPQAAWILDGKGFVLGRDGREARQIGPLVARDADSALGLLAKALGAVAPPLYVDLADHAPLQGFAQASGFAFQRPFTRMVRGAGPAPGNGKLVFLVAGPELG